MKKCSQCKKLKNFIDFYKNRQHTDGLKSECKVCCDRAAKLWHENNKARSKEVKKAYYHNNKEKNRDWQLQSLYGISLADYDKMAQQQNHSCKICTINKNQLKRPLCVDHDHLTNKVRGLLCDNCNKVLGLIKDSHNVALNMAHYLGEINGK